MNRCLLAATVFALSLAACETGGPAHARNNNAIGRAWTPDGGSEKKPSTTESLDRAEGAALFAKWCVPCHGSGGRGDGITASRLSVPPKNLTAPATCGLDQAAIETVVNKGARNLSRPGVMPPFGATLAPYQIRALSTHLKTLCGKPSGESPASPAR